jgi:uncharacterized protein (DUF1501 family)
MATRRVFLKNSALALFGVGAGPLWMQRVVQAAEAPRKKIIVAIFQRGAVDGLNMVVPIGEAAYKQLRPNIGVTDAIDLNGFFGLHPALAPLKAIYDAKQLAIVHAVGSPDPTRSHFDAQDYMESGTPGRKSTADGWLNRSLAADPKPSPVRAVSLGTNLARTLRGSNGALALKDVNQFQVRDAMSSTFESAYDKTGDTVLAGAARETFEAMRILDSVRKSPYQPRAEYPNNPLGQSLRQIARLIRADVGLEVAFADMAGWDTHANEPAQLQNLFTQFAGALSAFYNDLGDRMADVTVVTMSEFGRTAKENGARGTDHGHANVMLAFGGDVKGGKIYGDWPGLAPEQLYEGRDLAATTDFRDVLGELVTSRGGAPLNAVFPGYASPRFRGICT